MCFADCSRPILQTDSRSSAILYSGFVWHLLISGVLSRYRSLRKTAPQHAFLTDLEEKSQLFDAAASKFSAKVAA